MTRTKTDTDADDIEQSKGGTDIITALAKVTKEKAFDPELQRRFVEWEAKARAEEGIRNHEIAERLSASGRAFSTTAVSRYKNGKPEGNVRALEIAVSDLLLAESRREYSRTDLLETSVTREMEMEFHRTSRLGKVGMIFAAPGTGKTWGIRLWKLRHPGTPVVELDVSCGSEHGLKRRLFNAIDSRDWRPGTPVWDYLFDRFRLMPRLVIIDNAHRMTARCQAMVFDFHDATGCPIVLVGEPKIEQMVRREVFQMRRVQSICRPVLTDARAVATKMAARFFPHPAEGLIDMAEKVASKPGHLGNLTVQLFRAAELIEAAPKGQKPSPEKAFRMAHATLLRDYDL